MRVQRACGEDVRDGTLEGVDVRCLTVELVTQPPRGSGIKRHVVYIYQCWTLKAKKKGL